ncbi:3D-(3,5/4)-trihydroxycyclohexane-1,2-dione acylhydrolase (decyclizing) [Clostridium estertheticum]|uniref:3D-(3,5/4)-trihydroxycyclohexane-1,2-dione acylhydrolase (decyclizing) n=1 Tax=Clostridium estertheticum TaxID=238834 RepID=UPI001CF40E8C|nr:3D-(3,5/4)-trihydroxycyclohexane-1,2-dione acylhydrolase (decyclizing) [Clostridium estertheticum]MCB2309342.1 3D-(3,5/4)-trihydroxycyclohexane-1,2-dione acylhydrolase (decyclizing) [Clostridium estertheticum]MCB2347756.1 3D-(3,5/4)-trihydroxycyclohexane-1,2-dione acylhydrolase (decyclizing) [Clostridium estertheticum]MCB2352310.1 3D-(3,5/4)-trihydroxycyclohexane-1,2-dione acylhydrolase (decyclizing) [Clostridium estertheticum]WAG45398.1 3D-(3,5/4)-trihydroxycyclohexane-1,2-dione acylhydrola
MGTIRLTTAQALIKFLNNQFVSFDGKEERFVEGIFTIFGHGNVLGLGQALEQDPGDLIVRQGRNEQGMAQAAVAFAKQKRRKKIYACTSSVGPGAANMITAAATATANNIPVLLLPGDTFATRQPDPVLQQVEQEHNASISTNDAFKPVTKYWDRVSRPEQLMSAMINAMRVLTDEGDTGAVCIALPQDVQAEAYDYPEYFFNKRVHRIERRKGTDAELEDAISLIIRKKKPLIICGGGAKYSEAGEELKKFAQEFNIPIAETQAGKSTVESTHYLNLGGVGVTGNLAANLIAKDADLIIGLGTRFTDFTTGSKGLFKNDEVEFLTINTSRYNANKMDATKVVGDVLVNLEELIYKLIKKGYKSKYNKEISDAKNKWEKEIDRLYSIKYGKDDFKPEIARQNEASLKEFYELCGEALPQTTAIGEINKFLEKDYVVVGASGSLPGDLQRLWVSKDKYSYHMEYGFSCMGYEISGALGVKLAEPNKEVYAMVGDGSYLMLHSELVTSIQENKKINVLLFDNSGFGCINNLEMGNGMGSFGTEFRYRSEESGKLDGGLISIDFAKCAQGYGVKSYTVKTIEELKAALVDAKQQTRSTLIDIKTLPKTMTDGYDSWWHVGVAEVSNKESIKNAYIDKKDNLTNARKY